MSTELSRPRENPPDTPNSLSEFNADWVAYVVKHYFQNEEIAGDCSTITNVTAKENEIQGILSTTYNVEFQYQSSCGELEKMFIFVKVPLKDDVQFKNVNIKELQMLEEVLPQLSTFLDEKCEGFFRLPMPKLIYSYYDGQGEKDVFVLEDLLAKDYYNFTNQKCLNEDHMKSVLDCLSYLHGTGLAYKYFSGGLEGLKKEFPKLEVQIQLHDLIDNDGMRNHFKKHFRAFLHFLEEAEPAVQRHTAYMKKMHKHILKVIESLEGCGYKNLISFAHGDAKPNNFMFRKIQIDLEELECEGIDSILIDWQGGFLGSVTNDLMWALFPFIEKDGKLFPQAMEYYFQMLGTVLETFGLTLSDLELPTSFEEFASLLKKCLILEFLIVTVIKPIMMLEDPDKLWTWHKETLKNRKRRFQRKVVKPELAEVFSSPRFTGFCQLYFRIATSLGAFQELGKIYFEIMKDSMFEQDKYDFEDSDEETDTDLMSRILNAPTDVLVKASAGLVLAFGVILGAYMAWQQHKLNQI